MKNLKKIVCIIAALAMLVCTFAACTTPATTPTPTEGKGTAAPTVTPSATPSATPAGTASAFTTVKEGVLTMVTNAAFPPYEMVGEGGKFEGIDVEIAEAIAAKLGLTLEIKDIAFDSIIPEVKGGTADIGLAGMTITNDRLLDINFTVSYATGVQVVIVKDGSAITKVDDLGGNGTSPYKIGVQLGTTGDIYASEDYGKDNVVQYPNGAEAVAALIKGDIDCVIIDEQPAKSYVANNEGISILETKYATENYAACISKDNQALLDAVNGAIEDLTAEGKIAEIVGKYIKE